MIYNIVKLIFCALERRIMKIVNCGYDYRHPNGFRINRPNGSGDYILLIVRSPASFTFEGIEYFTNGNAVVIFNKGTPQMYGSVNTEYINDWIHFECDENDIKFLSELGIEFDKISEFQSVSVLSNFIKQMYFEKYSNNKNSNYSVEMYFNLILLKISDLCQKTELADTEMLEQLVELRNQIISNPKEPWKIDDIAKKLSISRSYLQHKYKEFFNTSIKKDVMLSRIEYSKYLLFATDFTISTIAELCGYENDVHFMRTFKKEIGFTPTEYRKSLNYSHYQVKESKNRNPFSL
jgi:AraC family transcriptional regulator of arabinose operon